MAGARIPDSVETVYVLDTQAWVWLLEGSHKLSAGAKAVVLNQRSRLALPSYCFEEMEREFPYNGVIKPGTIRIPPTAALRLGVATVNIRIIPRGSTGAIAEELRLMSLYRRKQLPIDNQDIPIVAVVMALRKFFPSTNLISKDGKLTKWAKGTGITVVW